MNERVGRAHVGKRRRWGTGVAAALALAMALGGCVGPGAGGAGSPSALGSLTGTVHLSGLDGSAGLAGATIMLQGPVSARTQTSASGAYTVKGLPAGDYTVSLELPPPPHRTVYVVEGDAVRGVHVYAGLPTVGADFYVDNLPGVPF